MKKYLSVFSLVARESMVRISLLWLVSAVLQAAVFYMQMFSERVIEYKFLSEAFRYDNDELCLPLVFALTLLLTGVLLMKTGMEFRTKTGYTLRRLRISEKRVFTVQAAYNCLMLFLLFVFETVLCFFLAVWGTTFIEPEYITNQTVYINFYASDFLQDIFGGRNYATVIRNIFIITSLSFNLSAFSYLWRRGSKYVFGGLVLVICAAFFLAAMGLAALESIAVTLVAIGALLIALGMVKTRREEYDA